MCNRQGHPRPLHRFNFKLAFSRPGEAIKLGTTIIFGFTPEGAKPTCFLHAVKGWK